RCCLDASLALCCWSHCSILLARRASSQRSTLSLHDALPILGVYIGGGYAVEERSFSYGCVKTRVKDRSWTHWYFLPFIDYGEARSEEHTSELQSRFDLVCRLLIEKKNKIPNTSVQLTNESPA